MTVKETAGDIVRFTNNTAGLEKILKALVGILLLPQTPTGKAIHPLTRSADGKLKLATRHISVARKVVRILYFFDSAFRAIDAKNSGHKGGLLKWLIVGKWACTFIFGATEMATILHAMDVLKPHKSRWHDRVHRSGQRFYFVAVCFSIAAAALELFELHKETSQRRRERRKVAYSTHRGPSQFSPPYSDWSSASESESVRQRRGNRNGTGGQSSSRGLPTYLAVAEAHEVGVDATRIDGTTNVLPPKSSTVVAHLLADVCDLAIPASRVGLFKNDEAVSFAHILHSVLAGSVIWRRVNAKPLRDTTQWSHYEANGNGNGDGAREERYRNGVDDAGERDEYRNGAGGDSYRAAQAVAKVQNERYRGHDYPGEFYKGPTPRPRGYSTSSVHSSGYPPLPNSEAGTEVADRDLTETDFEIAYDSNETFGSLVPYFAFTFVFSLLISFPS